MRILHNHNTLIAACYGIQACVMAAAGALGEAIFYGLVGALHALAARRGQGGPRPPSGSP